MIDNYLLLCVFGLSSVIVAGTLAGEAIIGGELADENNRFPYQVSVQVHGHGYVCGGGIIDDKFILTAARCVLNRDRQFRNPHISIHAGTNNYRNIDRPAVTVKVDKISFPSEYHPENANTSGDIAVLRVDSLELERRTHLVKLKLRQMFTFNRVTTITGYGWFNYNEVNDRMVGGTDARLRFAHVDILDNDICKEKYLYGDIHIHAHLCARIRQFNFTFAISTCFGDTGGPLVRDGTVIGILSRLPPDCNEEEQPGIYVRVSRYRKIISSAMQNKNHSDMISVYPFPS